MTALDPQPTIATAASIYGSVPLDDAAEAYHEASRLYPPTALAQLPGLALLETSPAARASAGRSSRLHRHRQAVELPPPRLGATALAEALSARRSILDDESRALRVGELAAVLSTAYGARGDPPRRLVPSAGALYPLELYVAASQVEEIRPGIYHHDPFGHRLELIEDGAPELAEALVDPTLASRAAAAIVVTCVFWRTRFKYGQRGYRFALLEAGHLAQNALLAAAALRLPALPVGGFYDRRVDELLGVDGLDEASLYLILLGGRR